MGSCQRGVRRLPRELLALGYPSQLHEALSSPAGSRIGLPDPASPRAYVCPSCVQVRRVKQSRLRIRRLRVRILPGAPSHVVVLQAILWNISAAENHEICRLEIYWESLGQQSGSPYGDDFGLLDASLLLDRISFGYGMTTGDDVTGLEFAVCRSAKVGFRCPSSDDRVWSGDRIGRGLGWFRRGSSPSPCRARR